MDAMIQRSHGQLSTQHTKPRPAPRHAAVPGPVRQLCWSFLASSPEEGKVSPLNRALSLWRPSLDRSPHLAALPKCWAQRRALGSQVGARMNEMDRVIFPWSIRPDGFLSSLVCSGFGSLPIPGLLGGCPG